jgi:hypothetical protein
MEVLSSIYTAVMSPWQPKKAEDDFDIHEDEETPEKASPVKIASFDEVDENQPTNKVLLTINKLYPSRILIFATLFAFSHRPKFPRRDLATAHPSYWRRTLEQSDLVQQRRRVL